MSEWSKVRLSIPVVRAEGWLEWLKASLSKSDRSAMVSRVQISPPPLYYGARKPQNLYPATHRQVLCGISLRQFLYCVINTSFMPKAANNYYNKIAKIYDLMYTKETGYNHKNQVDWVDNWRKKHIVQKRFWILLVELESIWNISRN